MRKIHPRTTLKELKVRLVAAHRAKDWELAKVLSQEKAKLLKRTKKVCAVCGVPLKSPMGEYCRIHYLINRFYSRSLAALVFIALGINCFGQAFTFNDLAFVCHTNAATGTGWGSPTNNTDGTYPNAWWVAGDFYTNGTVATLPDRSTNNWFLTNGTGQASCPKGINNYLNSLPVIGFTNALLKNLGYTNNSSVHSVWFVINLAYGNGKNILDGGISAARSDIKYLSDKTTTINFATATSIESNTWAILEVVWKANPCLSSVNLSNYTTTATSRGPTGGLYVGAAFDGSTGTPATIAEMIAYSSTNDFTRRSNIWYYLKGKYAL